MQKLYIQIKLIAINTHYPEIEIFDQPLENVRIVINELFNSNYSLLELYLAFPKTIEYQPVQEIPEDFKLKNVKQQVYETV